MPLPLTRLVSAGPVMVTHESFTDRAMCSVHGVVRLAHFCVHFWWKRDGRGRCVLLGANGGDQIVHKVFHIRPQSRRTGVLNGQRVQPRFVFTNECPEIMSRLFNGVVSHRGSLPRHHGARQLDVILAAAWRDSAFLRPLRGPFGFQRNTPVAYRAFKAHVSRLGAKINIYRVRYWPWAGRNDCTCPTGDSRSRSNG